MRTFLSGRFENSAFCLLTPDGQKWLTNGGRGPEMVLGRFGAASRMREFAAFYPARKPVDQALVPDFFSLRQALNVASADQRVLVVIHGSKDQTEPLRESLKVVCNDPDVIGRFHYDFEQSLKSQKTISGLKATSGIAILRSDEFGLNGEVMTHLPLDATPENIKRALLAANKEYARTTKQKVYSSHVAKGEQLGVYFEGNVEYGEDRDGDGEIDHRGPPGNRRQRGGQRGR